MERLRSKKPVFSMRFHQEVIDRLLECANHNDVAVADVVRALVNVETISSLNQQLDTLHAIVLREEEHEHGIAK